MENEKFEHEKGKKIKWKTKTEKTKMKKWKTKNEKQKTKTKMKNKNEIQKTRNKKWKTKNEKWKKDSRSGVGEWVTPCVANFIGDPDPVGHFGAFCRPFRI